MSVRLAIELILALYVISFVWFWSLCRVSSASNEDDFTSAGEKSEPKIIPFERGRELQDRKKTGT